MWENLIGYGLAGLFIGMVGLSIWAFVAQRRKANSQKEEEVVFHDPLDGSALREPVNLHIIHPDQGPMVVKVNRWNRGTYLKEGPGAFRKFRAQDSSKQYLARRENDSGGFDPLTSIMMYNLLFTDHGRIEDHNWQDSVRGGGGEFQGGGASGSFQEPSEEKRSDESFERESRTSVFDSGRESNITEEEKTGGSDAGSSGEIESNHSSEEGFSSDSGLSSDSSSSFDSGSSSDFSSSSDSGGGSCGGSD
jgi:hypothetical protein